MSSNSSAPPPSAAPPPSPDLSPPPSPPTANSSSPAPTNSDGPSPPPAPSNSSSHGAPSLPAGNPSPPSESSRGSSRPSSSQASTRRVGSNTTAEIIFAVAGAAALLALLVTACVCCSRRTAPRRRRRKPQNPMHLYADSSAYKGNSSYYTSEPQPQWQSDANAGAPSMSAPGLGSPGCSSWHVPPPDTSSGTHGQPMPGLGKGKGTFTYEELALATGDFSAANLLGQGGFGHVHKGVLPCGRAVAVKQLKSGSGQGEREFRAEVDIIGRVHHRHLVSLVGHCVAGDRRMLVYEFVPNKTLEFHLHGQCLIWPCKHTFQDFIGTHDINCSFTARNQSFFRQVKGCRRWHGRRGCGSRSGRPRGSPTCTKTAIHGSSTGTSSRPTSSWTTTSRPWWRTSGWPS
ncbi:hypothetical protein BRADI_1g07010v3 [Brachypodium distachyon]|uniref:non-specific serine/threonine protein kinase n=1 Tax=Brachypodium distachyon TaxID=15368 RepID=A0A0Q3KPA0_BRADI|nr:hypothetical protein BRADI_1g07010v3 [Brachypodium distachyon]